MSLESQKTDGYRKNDRLTELLERLNGFLAEIPDIKPTTSGRPIVLVVGVPRSGTTLITQLLSKTGSFTYPSNLISRFYNAPHVGALVQELLFNPEYDYKGELSLTPQAGGLRSDIGKTRGPLEPHEFWFFWRRFFTFPDIPLEESEFVAHADFQGFNEAVQAFGDVLDRPVSLKALIINPYVAAFGEALPNARFLHIRRDPIENMRSLLGTRQQYFGDASVWFSFKPKEITLLERESPERQVAGQVLLLDRMVSDGLARLPKEQWVTVDYARLCADPEVELNRIMETFGLHVQVGRVPEGVLPKNGSARTDDTLAEAWAWAVRTFGQSNS